MKKTILLLLLFEILFASSKISNAQTMLVWEKSYGGSAFDQPFGSEPTTDGGIILGGHSISNDGDITSNYGDYDWWVFKIDAAGNMVWQKSSGGSLYDKCRYATENPDGTSLAYGSVKSNDFDVTGNHSTDTNDYWLTKLDATGNILWSKCYGGTKEEGGRSVIRCHDGNYLLAGYSHSSNGDVTDHIGGYDVWLVKVDSGNGNIIWAKSYGGSAEERVRSIYQCPNGDFVFAGNAKSTDFDLTGTVNNGDEDVYVCRIDSAGNVIWAVQYGGPTEDRAYYCTSDADGNVLVAGKDSANGGDVTGNHGGSDCWVLKINFIDGSLMWQKNFGGTLDDSGFRIDPTQDGGYIIGATSESSDGDSPGNRGLSDFWFIKIDANLNIQWTRTDGGSKWDHLNDLVIKNDGSYVGIGFSNSLPGANSEITNNLGSFDYWLCKIVYCDSMASIIPGGTVAICSNESVTLTAPLAESYLWSTGETIANISVSAAGNYTVEITRANGNCIRTSLATTVVVSTVPSQPNIIISNDTLLCTPAAASYQWYYNGAAIPGATNNFLLNADSCGNYTVQISDINGCYSLSDPLFCPLTVNELQNSISSFKLFPNPANEKMVMSLYSKKELTAILIFYDAFGKNVLQKNFRIHAGNNSTEMNTKYLNKGIFIAEIKDESGMLFRKTFVKQ